MPRSTPAARTLLDREKASIGETNERFDTRIAGPIRHQRWPHFLVGPESGVEPDDRFAIFIAGPDRSGFRIDRQRFEVPPHLVGCLARLERAEQARPALAIGSVELELAPRIAAGKEAAIGQGYERRDSPEAQAIARQLPCAKQGEGPSRALLCRDGCQSDVRLQCAGRRGRAQPGPGGERDRQRGGKEKALRDAGLNLKDVSDETGFPEIMDGRVKTLHPKIHGGILGRRDIDGAVMAEHGIQPIDMVVGNLYPFEATIGSAIDGSFSVSTSK